MVYKNSWFIICILLILMQVSAAWTLNENVRVSTNGTGYYELNNSIQLSRLLINDTAVYIYDTNFTGYEIWDLTNGILLQNNISENITLPPISSDIEIRIFNFFNATGGSIINITGNYTWLNITFNNSETTNITLYMDAVNSECNYKATTVNYSTISYCGQSCTNCTILLVTNGSNWESNIIVAVSGDISYSNLPSIITAAAVTIVTIVILYRWD